MAEDEPPLSRLSSETAQVGLLAISDKELMSIFDLLSQERGVMDPAAVPLSRTCRRLDALYRLEYVTAYDSRPVQALDELYTIEADAVERKCASRAPRRFPSTPISGTF